MRANAFRFEGRRHLKLSTSMTLALGLLADALAGMLELTCRAGDAGDAGDAAQGEVTVNRRAPSPRTGRTRAAGF
jgi:hypothetical protein